MTAIHYAAFDLGASSGRAVLGALHDDRLTTTETHRFPNGPVYITGGMYWDVLRQFEEIKSGLRATVEAAGGPLDAIGIDTWGVDYGLFAAGGELLGTPRHYRDPRTRGLIEVAFKTVPREELYGRTGIQFMEFNTLYQYIATARHPSRLLDHAETLLFMPDLFNFWLTGTARTEFTIASTSQMLSAETGDWDRDMLERLGLPHHPLPRIVPTGTACGPLLPDIAEECGAGDATVIHTACHDSASAIAAIPATTNDWAYISSGTWSVIGVELPEPKISPETLAANFTNEGGVDGTTRFLTNIVGLWLIQECRRVWQSQGDDISYDQMMRLAGEAPPFSAFINPADQRFLEPCDMPARIGDFCREMGQPAPDSRGAIVRCALETLAFSYRDKIDTIERLIGRKIGTLHVVGGGAKNRMLSEFTASATGKPVVAGPVEGAAMGNVLVQAMARGRLGSLADIRRVVANSAELEHVEPRDTQRWDDAYARYRQVVERSR
jgi:sugar (pentulose or hexulose) kinase